MVSGFGPWLHGAMVWIWDGPQRLVLWTLFKTLGADLVSGGGPLRVGLKGYSPGLISGCFLLHGFNHDVRRCPLSWFPLNWLPWGYHIVFLSQCGDGCRELFMALLNQFREIPSCLLWSKQDTLPEGSLQDISELTSNVSNVLSYSASMKREFCSWIHHPEPACQQASFLYLDKKLSSIWQSRN